MKRFILVLLLSVAFMGMGIVGCDNDDGDNSMGPEMNGKAQVMVVHASPDAPGVDLLVDNSIVGSNLTFPNNTGYLQLDAGTYNIKVNVTGTSTTVIEADLA